MSYRNTSSVSIELGAISRNEEIGNNRQCHEGNTSLVNIDKVPKDSRPEPFENRFSGELFKHQIRFCLIKDMKASEGIVNCLNDIENGQVSIEHVTNEYQSLSSKHINLAFLWSSFVSRSDLLEPLYRLGANLLSTVPGEGFTALHLAAFSGCVTSCKWLIFNGLDLDRVARNWSPLHCAVLGNSLDCTSLLLEHGAALGNTVIHCAVQANAVECLQLLLNGNSAINAVDENGLTVLHVATDRNLKKCLQILLSHRPKADLDIQTKWRKLTPLHLAAENGYFECCQLLIDAGADVNIVSYNRQTALHLAAKAQCTDCLEILLDAGCDVNAQDLTGRSSLHAALDKTSHASNALEVLFYRGADVNLSDDYGYAPLHLAAQNELAQCVDYLVKNGADVSARTHGGLSALSIIGRKTPGSINTICRKLDSSISMTDKTASKKGVTLKFDFRYLLQSSSAGEVEFLKTLEKEGYRHLIEHPLCKAFLHLKWPKIRKSYFSHLFLCFFFVMLLTFYVIYALAHECYNAANCGLSSKECEVCFKNFDTAKNATFEECEKCLNSSAIVNNIIAVNSTTEVRDMCLRNNANMNRSAKNISNDIYDLSRNKLYIFNEAAKNISTKLNKLCPNNYGIDSFLIRNPSFIKYVWCLLALMAILKSIRKIITTLGHEFMKQSFFQFINLSEWLVILSVFLMSYRWYNWTFTWQKNIGGVAVLLVWIDFIIIIGQWPIFGDNVAMFAKAQTQFFELLFPYSCLLIGFTVSFCVIFPSDDYFQNPLVGFSNIFAITGGGFDFEILRENSRAEASWLLSISAHITLTFFLIFVAIVLMNMLMTTAVNDIRGPHETGSISKLVRQINLMHDYEMAAYNGLVPKKLVEILRRLALLSPEKYSLCLWVRPFHPREKKLPKEIMMAAFNLVKQRRAWTDSACCWSDTFKGSTVGILHQNQRNLYEEVRQLKIMVRNQNAMISELTKNHCGCK